jgi:hypothetical protein
MEGRPKVFHWAARPPIVVGQNPTPKAIFLKRVGQKPTPAESISNCRAINPFSKKIA